MKSSLTKEYEKGLKHFYDCINFADSNLDADATRFMNEMPGRLTNSHDALLKACKDLINDHPAGLMQNKPNTLRRAMNIVAQAEKQA